MNLRKNTCECPFPNGPRNTKLFLLFVCMMNTRVACKITHKPYVSNYKIITMLYSIRIHIRGSTVFILFLCTCKS